MGCLMNKRFLGFAERVVETLRRYPLLVLGFSLVVAAGTFSLGLAAAKFDNPAVLYVTAALFFFAMLIAAFLPKYAQTGPVGDEEIDHSISTLTTAARQASTGDQNVDHLIRKSIAATKKGLRIENRLLSIVIQDQWKDFADQYVDGFENGMITNSGESYQSFLVDVYQMARKSIFSTCVSEYMEGWNKSLGQQIMEANAKDNTTDQTRPKDVTRVFIFKSAQESEQWRQVMSKQAAAGVKVYFFIESTPDQTPMPPSWDNPRNHYHKKDFTIVDSLVVGITMDFVKPTATWYFTSKVVEDFEELKGALLEMATPFNE